MQAASKDFKTKFNWRVWLFFALLLCVGASLFLYSQFRAPIPRVVMLPLRERPPSKFRIAVEGWWWWLKSHLLGPGKSILLSASIMDLKSPLVLFDLSLPKADFSNTDEFQVWILNDGEMQRLGRHMQQSSGTEVISKPRIQTASGIQGAMWAGQPFLWVERIKRLAWAWNVCRGYGEISLTSLRL